MCVETNRFKGSLAAPSHSATFFCSLIAILETTVIDELASAKAELKGMSRIEHKGAKNH